MFHLLLRQPDIGSRPSDVSLETSINLGKMVLRMTQLWTTADPYILTRFFIDQSSIISHIFDSNFWMVTIFICDGITLKEIKEIEIAMTIFVIT